MEVTKMKLKDAGELTQVMSSLAEKVAELNKSDITDECMRKDYRTARIRVASLLEDLARSLRDAEEKNEIIYITDDIDQKINEIVDNTDRLTQRIKESNNNNNNSIVKEIQDMKRCLDKSYAPRITKEKQNKLPNHSVHVKIERKIKVETIDLTESELMPVKNQIKTENDMSTQTRAAEKQKGKNERKHKERKKALMRQQLDNFQRIWESMKNCKKAELHSDANNIQDDNLGINLGSPVVEKCVDKKREATLDLDLEEDIVECSQDKKLSDDSKNSKIFKGLDDGYFSATSDRSKQKQLLQKKLLKNKQRNKCSDIEEINLKYSELGPDFLTSEISIKPTPATQNQTDQNSYNCHEEVNASEEPVRLSEEDLFFIKINNRMESLFTTKEKISNLPGDLHISSLKLESPAENLKSSTTLHDCASRNKTEEDGWIYSQVNVVIDDITRLENLQEEGQTHRRAQKSHETYAEVPREKRLRSAPVRLKDYFVYYPKLDDASDLSFDFMSSQKLPEEDLMVVDESDLENNAPDVYPQKEIATSEIANVIQNMEKLHPSESCESLLVLKKIVPCRGGKPRKPKRKRGRPKGSRSVNKK